VGALIGAALARDIPVDQIRAEMHQFARKHPLREVVFPRHSLLSGRNLHHSLRRWFQDLCIEDMPLRFACVTTNMSRGAVEAHRRGKLETVIAASCSVPGIFPPTILNGDVHVDGGILNNLPAKLARGLGAGYVIGVDAGVRPMSAKAHSRSAEVQPIPNILELLMQVGTMSDAARGARADERADMLLLPDVQELGILNWRASDWAVMRGYDCAVAQIGPIKLGIAALQHGSRASELSASASFG
jgi:NTE family protein